MITCILCEVISQPASQPVSQADDGLTVLVVDNRNKHHIIVQCVCDSSETLSWSKGKIIK